MKTFILFVCALFAGSFSAVTFAAEEKPTKYTPVYAAFVLPKCHTIVLSNKAGITEYSYPEDYVVRMNGYAAVREDHTLAHFNYPPRLINTRMQNVPIEIANEPTVIATFFVDKDTHFVFTTASFDGSEVIDATTIYVRHEGDETSSFGFYVSPTSSARYCN